MECEIGFMPNKIDEKPENEECEEEKKRGAEGREYDWEIWTDPLEELVEIEGAFEADEKDKLTGKTILDVGTDCVKPLYIALKFEPESIVGINEGLYSFGSDIEQKSKLLTKTKIHFYNCSLFDEVNFKKIFEKENTKKFDFVLVSKTLHHLRAGKCGLEHTHREDEKCCVYKFEVQNIFDRLLQLGNRVIVYESFYPQEIDEDKVRGRGGYFNTEEWRMIFTYLSKNYNIELVTPLMGKIGEKELENVFAKLRQMDYVCFYVEKK